MFQRLALLFALLFAVQPAAAQTMQISRTAAGWCADYLPDDRWNGPGAGQRRK